MTNTTGTSDIVFGLFWLLGYPLRKLPESVTVLIIESDHFGLQNYRTVKCILISLPLHFDDGNQLLFPRI